MAITIRNKTSNKNIMEARKMSLEKTFEENGYFWASDKLVLNKSKSNVLLPKSDELYFVIRGYMIVKDGRWFKIDYYQELPKLANSPAPCKTYQNGAKIQLGNLYKVPVGMDKITLSTSDILLDGKG